MRPYEIVLCVDCERSRFKFLGEKTLDFSKALQIAQSMEMEEKKSSELKDWGSSGMLKTKEVHRLGAKARKPRKFSKETGEKSKGAWYRCGSTEHNSSELSLIHI